MPDPESWFLDANDFGRTHCGIAWATMAHDYEPGWSNPAETVPGVATEDSAALRVLVTVVARPTG